MAAVRVTNQRIRTADVREPDSNKAIYHLETSDVADGFGGILPISLL